MNKPVKLTLCVKSQDVEVVAYMTLESKSKRGNFIRFFKEYNYNRECKS